MSDFEHEESRAGRSKRPTTPEPATRLSVDILSKNIVSKSEIDDLRRSMKLDIDGLGNRIKGEMEKTKRFMVVCCAALMLAWTLLWFRHSREVSELRLELRERSVDRITSGEVLRLLEMHSNQPHVGAADRERLEALERKLSGNGEP